MKHLTAYALSLMALSVVLSTVCFATDYIVEAPEPGPFARETSVSLPYVEQNVDKSKTAAIIPPTFGSPTSYVPVMANYLTPNLVDSTVVNPSYTDFVVDDGFFQSVTDYDDFFYSYDVGDTIGYLSIPDIGVATTIYEGTTNDNLRNGVGHFTGTGITSGNVCIAGHNRGISNIFGQIHTLDKGDNIYYTVNGEKSHYDVVSVTKISVDNLAVLNPTTKDQITLITCVANQPSYRWCIVAR